MTYDEALGDMIAGREFFDDLATLALTGPLGRPIALMQAVKGWRTTDPAVLALATPHGFTVADHLADFTRMHRPTGAP